MYCMCVIHTNERSFAEIDDGRDHGRQKIKSPTTRAHSSLALALAILCEYNYKLNLECNEIELRSLH
jgi:hypothetical protein